MKLLLDMYKGVSKEQRDKVQLMASEKKIRAELEDLRQQLKKLQVLPKVNIIICTDFVYSPTLFSRKVKEKKEKN